MLGAYTLKKEKHDLASLVSDAQARKCFYLYNAIKAHLDPKPKLLAFDAERAKKLKSPITHALFQPNVTVDNLPNTATSTQRCTSASEQLATNPHKIKNKTKACSFDQKNPGSCHKGESCAFLHGNLELKVPIIDTKKANGLKSQIVHSPIDAKVTVSHTNVGTINQTQFSAIREEKDKSKNKSILCRFDQKNPGSCRKGASCNFSHGNNQQVLSIHTAQRNLNSLSKLPAMNLKPATSTITSQIATSTKMPATSTLKSGPATSTTTSTIASKVTIPVPKPGARTLTTTSQITTSPTVSSTAQAINSASEKRVNDAKREGVHRRPQNFQSCLLVPALLALNPR